MKLIYTGYLALKSFADFATDVLKEIDAFRKSYRVGKNSLKNK